MKGELDEESRIALIHYRFQRADLTLKEALIMNDAGHYNAAINRLYYACYYAVVAGWTLYYAYEALIGGFSGKSPEDFTNDFVAFSSDSLQPVF